MIYTAIASWILLKLTALVTELRVSEQDEDTGLDLVLHDEAGYRY